MLSPGFNGRQPERKLLPEDLQLIELLGWSEEEFFWFESQKAQAGHIRPGEPVADFGTSLLLLVIGVALNFAAQALIPVNKPGTPARIENNQVDGQDIVRSDRFAPTAGFDGGQNAVELGSVVPVVFAKREVIDGITYGGVRVNSNVLWWQMFSLGGSQLIKALFMLAYKGITSIDPKQFAIGNNLLSSYDLATSGNVAGRLSFYFRSNGGRIRSTDLIAGRGAAYDTANSENAGGADVFQVRSVNGVWQSDFCFASLPSTQKRFGLYAPIGNDLAYRVNPQIRSISVASLRSVGSQGDAIVQCNNDVSAEVLRRKQFAHYSTRSGIVSVKGVATTHGQNVTVAKGDVFSYRLSSASDYSVLFLAQNGTSPIGQAGCEDVAQAISGLQRTWDDSLIPGELYRVGTCVAVVEDRSPAGAVFRSVADSTPIGNGQDITVQFRVVRAGQFLATSNTQIDTGMNSFIELGTNPKHQHGSEFSHIHRLAIAAFVIDRPAQVVEIGFKSNLSIRINGLCNFSSSKSYIYCDLYSCLLFNNFRISKGTVLQTATVSSGTYTGPEERYSFFRLSYRIGGSDAAWTKLPQLFGMRSITGQPDFNYIRLQMPSEQRWEYELMPVSAWDIRSGAESGNLEVLDSRMNSIRTIYGGNCIIEFSGVQVPRTKEQFAILPTEQQTVLGLAHVDFASYADAWGKLAEQFVFSEITASTSSPEHEVSYVNVFSRNKDEPTYDALATIGATIRSGPEFTSFQQLSSYVNAGFGDTHAIGDVLRYFLLNSDFGLGEIIAPQQLDNASFDAANAWTRARRYFFDAGVAEPFNYLQQGTQWAEYFLHDLLIRGGKFYLQPIAEFNTVYSAGSMYTSGNVSEFEYTKLDPQDRTPPVVVAKWREEKQSSDLAGRGLFPVVREVTVREASTPETAPITVLDMSPFCTNELHAIDAAKMFCRKVRLISSRVQLTTKPEKAAFDPGKLIRIGMETVEFDEPNNGCVLADGTVVSIPATGVSQGLPDGSYTVFIWNGTGADVTTTSMVVSGGKAPAHAGSMFCLATVIPTSQTYRVQKVDFTPEGDVEVEATEFPLDANGYSLLTAGWDVPGNWVIEGRIGTFDGNTTLVPTFLGVQIQGLAALQTGGTESYNADVTGPAGTYTYVWTCAGATIATPTAAVTNITFPTAGNYTVSVAVTLAGVTKTDSLVVTVGAVVTSLIGDVTVAGPTAANIGAPAVYTATRAGDATGLTWRWDVDQGDPVVTASGTSATIAFNQLGSHRIQAQASSSTAADSPRFGFLDVTVTLVPTITLAISNASVLEDGATNLIYTFTRSEDTIDPLVVNYSIGGTAVNGVDYATISSSVTIPIGSSTATVTINPTADFVPEFDETVSLTLLASSTYLVGTSGPVIGTIVNDDYGQAPDIQRVTGTVTVSLDQNATITGTIPLLPEFVLVSIETNKAGWLRLYNNNAAMVTDAARLRQNEPKPHYGVIADPVFLEAETIDYEPAVLVFNRETTPTNVYPFRLTNDGASGAYILTITYMPISVYV